VTVTLCDATFCSSTVFPVGEAQYPLSSLQHTLTATHTHRTIYWPFMGLYKTASHRLKMRVYSLKQPMPKQLIESIACCSCFFILLNATYDTPTRPYAWLTLYGSGGTIFYIKLISSRKNARGGVKIFNNRTLILLYNLCLYSFYRKQLGFSWRTCCWRLFLFPMF
jgi:hypothetical protein